ncbi:siderophore-interacting protein [Streptomyces nitrosporeus]|uniref:Siderophore-interacting protein n=1 Tax=Streptomyces nitrosporeus TaxID=28894 RepID=A0A5J6FID1_9ACTN|nr:siderophore-interacting protein [Streptomyces nitrosporeus]QEU75963.1 siderophore-interacting protein [Streptomyces nitrosporeus]GGY89800.1 siderophore-interacting protein [Streptomyces nitrosporeus]
MTIHRAVVARVQQLTAAMTRVTLHGEGVAGFVSTGTGDEYVRLFFPHGPDRTDVSLPRPAGKGRWEVVEGRPVAPVRTYTVRAVRPEAGEIDIDFVLHEGGIASGWAAGARPGDVLGLNDPTALYNPPPALSWQVLIADHTGLPALARLLENTEPDVMTRVVVEVPDATCVQPLPGPPDLKVTWSYGGNGHGPSRLADLVTGAVPAGTDVTGGYIWVAGQTNALREVRRYLRKELGLPAERYKAVGYWIPQSDTWAERYQALPDSVRSELEALWDSPAGESEDRTIRYETRLSALGL